MVDASILSLVSVLVQPATIFGLFLILSLTLNLEFGYTGIPNFGKVLFVIVGAYVAGSVGYRLMAYVLNLSGDIFTYQGSYVPAINARLGHDPLMALGLTVFMLGIGGVLGGLAGFLSSYPAIRLKEDYLGMLLLANGEFFNIFSLAYIPFLGGGQGSLVPDPVYPIADPEGPLVVLGVVAAFALTTYLYAERVGRSPLGRTLRAVRDNEVASEALGKDNVAIRRNVLIVGSAIAGMTGVLFLFYQPYIQPGVTGSFTRQTMTFVPFVIVILGGMSNNRGVLLGTFVYMAIIQVFSQGTTYVLSQGYVFPVGLDPNRLQPMLIGAILILILLKRPQGLIPEKSTLTMKKSKLRELADLAMAKPKGAENQERKSP